MPFLRLSRDRRGYESTFLLHARHVGERPTVLYWYRTAPGVRVGRPALDEDAIRVIEEQHPDIEFDWGQILEVGAATLVEAEPVAAWRRKPPPPSRRSADSGRSTVRAADERIDAPELKATAPAATEGDQGGAVEPVTSPETAPAHDLLEELVGREIATRLRARYAELAARITRLPLEALARDAWRMRAEAVNPDNWVTPDEILAGVQHAGQVFDDLRRELPSPR
ncbi:MAG: hypothetical protein ABR606_11595 [Vicinamibacterales bacterium]